VILNRSAQVFEVENRARPHCLVITSQGVRDKAPISTVLSCGSDKEQKQWIAALRGAIEPEKGGAGGKRKSRFIASTRGAGGKSVRSIKAASNRTAGLAQMAKYEREELKQLKVNVLKDILEFLDVNFERKNKDVLYHVDLIVNQQRLLASAQAFAGGFKAWRERGVSQDRGMDSQNV